VIFIQAHNQPEGHLKSISLLFVVICFFTTPSISQTPALVSTDPMSFDPSVPVFGPIQLSFSSDIIDVSEGAVRVLGSLSGFHEANIEISGRDVVIHPNRPFWAGEHIRVAVGANGIHSANGGNSDALELQFVVETQPTVFSLVLADSIHIPSDPDGGSIAIHSFGIHEATGDGIPDLLIVGEMVLLVSPGVQSFEVPFPIQHDLEVPIELASESTSIDFDGDHVSDVLIRTNWRPGPWLYWLTEKGQSFEPVQISHLLSSIHGAADFDGDGSDELLVSDESECGFSLLQWSDGRVQETLASDGGQCWSRNVELADLNNDGVPELVSGPGISVRFLEDGVFQPRGQVSLSSRNGWELADVTNDGYIDAIGYSFGGGLGGGAEVIIAQGGPTASQLFPFMFREAQRLFVQAFRELDIGDVDGDGDLDIVALSHNRDPQITEVSFLENDGHGNFDIERRVALPFTDIFSSGLLYDWNGDGRLGYVAHSRNAVWFFNFQPLATHADSESVPAELRFDAYPNPFESILHFDGLLSSQSVFVYDILGRHVATTRRSWDGNTPSGRPTPPGIYLLRAENTESFISVVKL